MVEIQVKDAEEKQQFVYECECSEQIEEIAKDIIEIYNLITKIQYLDFTFQQQQCPLQGCHEDVARSLTRALSEAQAYASKDIALNKRPLSPHVLRDHIQTIEGEVLKSQLMGFSDSNQLQKLYSDMELLQEDTTKLWWAGKEFLRSKRLCDYVGKNEKTKILIKLEKPSLGSARQSDKGFSYEKAS
ncbi:cilia- and flagella-associated protein 298-B-like [Papaver somniferum]|uniref:cilia- and flagella-associated protein 298-B-like n=1 Tax=Papaver somniferum TaxID=3469 RepID=UPI000E6FBFAA|nr:cilia- and flagella-associated protein 298-B-like [Papaver somniferum]